MEDFRDAVATHNFFRSNEERAPRGDSRSSTRLYSVYIGWRN